MDSYYKLVRKSFEKYVIIMKKYAYLLRFDQVSKLSRQAKATKKPSQFPRILEYDVFRPRHTVKLRSPMSPIFRGLQPFCQNKYPKCPRIFVSHDLVLVHVTCNLIYFPASLGAVALPDGRVLICGGGFIELSKGGRVRYTNYVMPEN